MSWFDSLIAFVILAFIFLLVWSRVQKQTMRDTFKEIKGIIGGSKKE